jgi:ketosteroid isomerase-like protein
MLRILDRGYQLLWREGRLEDAAAGLGEDFEWVVPGHPEGDVRRGRDAVIAFFRDWAEPFEDLEVEWELREVDGGRVLAIIQTRGRGRASGAPVEMRFAQLWTHRNRRFVSMVFYYDVEEALREVRSLSDVARELFEGSRREGVEGLLPYLAENVVWEEDPGWPDAETWQGHEGVRATFRERLDSTSIEPELEEVRELPGRVLMLMRWTGQGEGSGAVGVLRPAAIVYFDRQLVSRVRFFLDRDRAREVFEDA